MFLCGRYEMYVMYRLADCVSRMDGSMREVGDVSGI